MAGLETLASVDYSLCIKAGVHFTLCGGMSLFCSPGESGIPICIMSSINQPCLSADSEWSGALSGTIAKLGTEKHHRTFLPRLDTLDLPGCFG